MTAIRVLSVLGCVAVTLISPMPAAAEKSLTPMLARVIPAVVSISTEGAMSDSQSALSDAPSSVGSGSIIDAAKGLILTDYHVIQEAETISVTLSDGRSFEAQTVGTDAATDLAVIKIDAVGLTQLTIGDSDGLRIGDYVVAVGNPFGLSQTVTHGIVSALGRTGFETGAYEGYIQTDAAINPGNSGGPLLDSAGRLIGINTAIYSPSGASAGVGFAVPVDTVNRVVPQLIGQGKYVRPSLGIEIDQDLNEAITEQLGVKGVAILKVRSNSPAARAGFRGITINRDRTITPGDIITAVQGKQVETIPKLLARLDDFKVGDTVTITILRDGKQQQRSVQLQAE